MLYTPRQEEAPYYLLFEAVLATDCLRKSEVPGFTAIVPRLLLSFEEIQPNH